MTHVRLIGLGLAAALIAGSIGSALDFDGYDRTALALGLVLYGIVGWRT